MSTATQFPVETGRNQRMYRTDGRDDDSAIDHVTCRDMTSRKHGVDVARGRHRPLSFGSFGINPATMRGTVPNVTTAADAAVTNAGIIQFRFAIRAHSRRAGSADWPSALVGGEFI